MSERKLTGSRQCSMFGGNGALAARQVLGVESREADIEPAPDGMSVFLRHRPESRHAAHRPVADIKTGAYGAPAITPCFLFRCYSNPQTSDLTAIAAWAWLGSRVVYLPLYWAEVPYVRSLVWGVATLGLIMILGVLLFS